MLVINKKIKQISFIIFFLLLLSVVAIYYFYNKKYPSTDNAYVQANTIYIASRVPGPILNLKIANYEKVKKDQLLFQIDPIPYQLAFDKENANLHLTEQRIAANKAALETSEAVIKQRQAELALSKKNAYRIITLVKQGQLSPATRDDAQSKLAVAQASLVAAQHQYEQFKNQLGDMGEHNADLQTAKAALREAALNLSYTQIKAPANGLIINFNLRAGSMITSEQPLFALIENKGWWIDANFKETELENIREGQKAKIKIDIYPKKIFQGRVIAISQGSGAAFSIFPPENATGNWIKITQRFPVKIIITNPDPHYPLRVGASCEVTIDTTSV
ncbi:MAG: Colistin resistance protein EmrA [Legionellaceae bacterium]